MKQNADRAAFVDAIRSDEPVEIERVRAAVGYLDHDRRRRSAATGHDGAYISQSLSQNGLELSRRIAAVHCRVVNRRCESVIEFFWQWLV